MSENRLHVPEKPRPWQLAARRQQRLAVQTLKEAMRDSPEAKRFQVLEETQRALRGAESRAFGRQTVTNAGVDLSTMPHASRTHEIHTRTLTVRGEDFGYKEGERVGIYGTRNPRDKDYDVVCLAVYDADSDNIRLEPPITPEALAEMDMGQVEHHSAIASRIATEEATMALTLSVTRL